MKVLVTGATGFVGGNLVHRLLRRGHEVQVLARPTSNLTGLRELTHVQIKFGDLRTGEGLGEAVAGVERVFHIAGVVKARTAEDFHRGNVEGTRRVCEAISAHAPSARLIVCSSLAAAGPTTSGRPRKEEQIPAPVSTYGKSKLAAEQVVREYAQRISSVIVRPPIVYGPGDRENIPSFLPMAKVGVFLKPSFGPKEYSVIHVEDLCEALISAGESERRVSQNSLADGVYFVSDGQSYSWSVFCTTLAQALGRQSVVTLPIPNVATYAIGWVSEVFARIRGHIPIMNLDKAREMSEEAWTCAIDKAQTEISFKPKLGLHAGMKNTLPWFRQEGLL